MQLNHVKTCLTRRTLLDFLLYMYLSFCDGKFTLLMSLENIEWFKNLYDKQGSEMKRSKQLYKLKVEQIKCKYLRTLYHIMVLRFYHSTGILADMFAYICNSLQLYRTRCFFQFLSDAFRIKDLTYIHLDGWIDENEMDRNGEKLSQSGICRQ